MPRVPRGVYELRYRSTFRVSATFLPSCWALQRAASRYVKVWAQQLGEAW